MTGGAGRIVADVGLPGLAVQGLASLCEDRLWARLPSDPGWPVNSRDRGCGRCAHPVSQEETATGGPGRNPRCGRRHAPVREDRGGSFQRSAWLFTPGYLAGVPRQL